MKIDQLTQSELDDYVRDGILIKLRDVLALAAGLDPREEIFDDAKVIFRPGYDFIDAWNFSLRLIQKGLLTKYTVSGVRGGVFDAILAFVELKNAGFKLCDRVEGLLAQHDKFELPVILSENTLRTKTRANPHQEVFEQRAKDLWAKKPSLTIRHVCQELHNLVDSPKKYSDGKRYAESTIRTWIKKHCPNPKRGNPRLDSKRQAKA